MAAHVQKQIDYRWLFDITMLGLILVEQILYCLNSRLEGLSVF